MLYSERETTSYTCLFARAKFQKVELQDQASQKANEYCKIREKIFQKTALYGSRIGQLSEKENLSPVGWEFFFPRDYKIFCTRRSL